MLELLEDKIFFVCQFTNPKGKLITGPEGEYAWVTKAEVDHYLQKPVQEIKDIFKMLTADKLSFIEKDYQVSDF